MSSAVHHPECNELCDETGHYLLADWTTAAARESAVAEAHRRTAHAALATRAALIEVRHG